MVCPYKGLASFDAEDAEYFFGRERLVAELVARLVGAPLLAVVGPSGSGKSSVVRAGLLPALAGGVLPGSDHWAQALIRPGEQPLRELRRATRRLAREWHSVLVVDQFEELFTACQDEAGARRSSSPRSSAPPRRAARVVVLAVRADFYGRCAAYPELSRLLGANHVLVGPMSRDELRRAIERPAQRVGLSVEPELVEALLADVEGQPGALPLLSTALLELWRERDRRRLRLAAYARSGGVQGAVARLAEDALRRASIAAHQAAARRLLLRLADEDESGAVVRRRIALAELEATEHGAEVVARLTDRRLLTVSDGAVEVAHEALLREWPRLRAWLDEDAQGRRLHRRLSDAARAWDADARDPGELYRGAPPRRRARLGGRARRRAQRDRARVPRRQPPRERARPAPPAGRARRGRRPARARGRSPAPSRSTSAATRAPRRPRPTRSGSAPWRSSDDDLDRALLLARQGMALDDSPQTRGNLLAVLLKSPAAIGVLGGDGDRLIILDLSPDGARCASSTTTAR